MLEASSSPLPRILDWPLMLISMAALSVVVFGDGDGIVRRVSGVLTITCFGSMFVYHSVQITRGKRPFRYKPTRGDPTEIEFLPMLAALGVLGLRPFWPELSEAAIVRAGFAPFMIGSLYRLLVLRDW